MSSEQMQSETIKQEIRPTSPSPSNSNREADPKPKTVDRVIPSASAPKVVER